MSTNVNCRSGEENIIFLALPKRLSSEFRLPQELESPTCAMKGQCLRTYKHHAMLMIYFALNVNETNFHSFETQNLGFFNKIAITLLCRPLLEV
jgi:hypothetical protein